MVPENVQPDLPEYDAETLTSSDDDIPLSHLRSRNAGEFYHSINNTKWSKTPLPHIRRQAQDINIRIPSARGAAREADTPLRCFELYFDDSIFTLLVENTNKYIEGIKAKFERERDARSTDLLEIRAFVGMLVMIGVSKGGRRNLKDFWDNSKGTGVECIYCTLSQNRFRFLLRCLRFDDSSTRIIRREQDRLAPVRHFVEHFIGNCRKYYLPSEMLTLDEQLVGFRGRCGFIVYIPIKPDKFGIKIYMLADTKYPYIYNFEIYAGKQPEGPFNLSNKVVDVTKRLISPIFDYKCNVTMDNYFTNLNTSLELLSKKITTVGTMKANRPEIPAVFKANRSRRTNSSIFGFQKDATLVSYVPKPSKSVILLSTKHHNDAIDVDTGEKRKPEIVTFYNNTKWGVDIVDKMCKQYSVMRNSRRWPLTLFFNMTNIAGINALVINQINSFPQKIVRREFLSTVAFDLMKPYMLCRMSITHIPKSIRTRIGLLLNIPEDPIIPETDKRGRVGHCYACGRSKNKSTRKWCKRCNKWACNAHLVNICLTCHETNSNN